MTFSLSLLHAREFTEDVIVQAYDISHLVVLQLHASGQDSICVGDIGTNMKLRCTRSMLLGRFGELHVEQAVIHGMRRMGAGNLELKNEKSICICINAVRSESCVEYLYCCVKMWNLSSD